MEKEQENSKQKVGMTVLISDEIDFMRQQLISSEGNVPNDKKSI